MLFFYDVPLGAPKATGSSASSFVKARNEIEAKWKPFLSKRRWTKPLGKADITIGTLGNALSRLNVDGMPLDRCHQYVQLYLESAPSSVAKAISARPWMGGLSADHRRCADEILACTLSLDVARVTGYKFIGHREYVNKELEVFGTDAWTYLWKENGPDYLLAGNGHFAFLESKGQATEVKRSPKNFSEYKAQSLNAELHLHHGAGNIALSARHILSYVYLPAGGVGADPAPATVQWFNAGANAEIEGRSVPEVGSGIITAAVALAEFSLHCRNQGVDYLDVLYVESQAGEINRPAIRYVSDEHMPFVLLSNSGFGPALAIAIKCVRRLRRLHTLLRNTSLKISSSDDVLDIILSADKAAFRLLATLEEVAVLSGEEKDALERHGLTLRFGATQQVFSTGLFTVSIPRSS